MPFGFLYGLCPALTIVGIWGMNQQMTDLSVSLFLFLSPWLSNKIHFLNDTVSKYSLQTIQKKLFKLFMHLKIRITKRERQ